MDTARYKRNVFRTLSIKGAKAGLRGVARSTLHTNVAHAIVGLNTEVGELFEGLQPYLLGFQLRDEMKQNAFEELGDFSYYMIVLAKALKLKVPGSGKKTKLVHMTKTEALLKINGLSVDLLDQFKKTFYGRELDLEKIAPIAQEILNLYWPLVYDLLGVTPAVVFEGNIAKLEKRYPDGMFSDNAQEFRDAQKEMVAMTEAVNGKHENALPATDAESETVETAAEPQ